MLVNKYCTVHFDNLPTFKRARGGNDILLIEEAKKGAVTCPGMDSWKQNENNPEL